MAKKKESYICSSCGYVSSKWMGQCPQCGSWNTLEEVEALPQEAAPARAKTQVVRPKELRPLKDITADRSRRYVTGIGEFDRVLGGGLVRDSLLILAAKPGAGKSTLLLQTAQCIAEQGHTVLYISGEESESQIRRRAERILSGIHPKIWVYATTSMNQILGAVQETDPSVMIIDSIQTMALDENASRPGSPTQVMECTQTLMKLAKDPDHPRAILMAGQLTKDDELAGVRSLEHMVDTVLYMEADNGEELRMLSATKNRFGSTGEMGFFTMEEDGLKAIDNPSEYFMTRRAVGQEVTGSALTVVKEGTRPVIAEVEALVSQSFTPYPSRISECMKRDQLSTLISILEQRGGQPLYDKNVVIKTTGGLKLNQQSANLAVILAIVSSSLRKSIPVDHVFIGDVGLTGELKKVPQMESRIRELQRMGFRRVYIPAGALRREVQDKYQDIEIKALRTLSQVLRDVFGDIKPVF